MSCYVDGLFNYGWKLGKNCHLIADTEEELHAMATSIGMKKAWLQKGGRRETPHYDLTASRRKMAIAKGVIELNRSQFCEMVENIGNNKTKS